MGLPGPSGIPTGEGVLIDWDTPLEELKTLGVRSLTFKCSEITPSEPKEQPTAYAFSVLIASGRCRRQNALCLFKKKNFKFNPYLP